MIWGHNLGWWGSVLGIAAFILMIPANLLANFLTPFLKNWWSERSMASLRKRIAKLEGELSYNEQNYEALSEFEEYALEGIEMAGILAGIIMLALVVVFLLTVVQASPFMRRMLLGPMFLLSALMIVMTIASQRFVFNKITEFRKPRSERERSVTRQSLSQLRRKLAERKR